MFTTSPYRRMIVFGFFATALFPAYAQSKSRTTPKDDQQAAVYWQKMAETGDKDAQFQLASIYDNGLGITQDYVAAAKWYRKAALQGHVGAEAGLGFLYYVGHGVPQDFTEAASWFTKAALAGDPAAQVFLGVLYGSGQGVEQSWAYCYFWSNLGASGTTGGVQEQAAKSRDFAAAQLSSDQVTKLQKACREWADAHPRKS